MINGEVPLYIAGNKGHVFICMHGAGHSSQSFAALAKHLKNDYIVCAFDFRGHGDNSMANEHDLSEETLVGDAIAAIRYINTTLFSEASVIIVGHSMGGSIATKATAKIGVDHSTEQWAKQISGLFVIDVVEGSAMEALPFMENIVMSRPPEFKSLSSVIQWAVKTGQVKDLESARVSMPPQVVAQVDEASGQVI
jgi:protein phosphatase methylesterase 1